MWTPISVWPEGKKDTLIASSKSLASWGSIVKVVVDLKSFLFLDSML